TGDGLAGKAEALVLYHGITDWPQARRNTIRYTFCHPAARELFADWEQAAASTAAHLHALLATEPGDPDVAALIDSLLADSPEFARLWPRHEGRHRRGSAETVHHPRVRPVPLAQAVPA